MVYNSCTRAYAVVLHRFVNEYEEYKGASEEVAEKLRREVQLLYEYTEKLTHVMERIECGMCVGWHGFCCRRCAALGRTLRYLSCRYPVRDRGGIKSMLIPPEDKPGKMPIERCEELQRLLGHAQKFVNQHESHQMEHVMRSEADEIAAMSLDDLRDEIMRLRSQEGAAASGGGGGSAGAGGAMMMTSFTCTACTACMAAEPR